MAISLTNLYVNHRLLDRAFMFLIVWYYCTLTIRESILRVNGSKIKVIGVVQCGSFHSQSNPENITLYSAQLKKCPLGDPVEVPGSLNLGSDQNL